VSIKFKEIKLITPLDDVDCTIYSSRWENTLFLVLKGHQPWADFECFKTKLNGDNQVGEVENLAIPQINTHNR